MKAKPLFLALTLILVLAFSNFSANPAMAQERVNPHTPVSEDGMEALPEFSGLSDSAPKRGTGILPESGPYQIPEEELRAIPLDGGKYPESVIGADGRSRVNPTTSYPSRAIVWMTFQFPNQPGYYSCTGWLIGPRTVATAGHCVYDNAKKVWAINQKFYPARNGSVAPYGYAVKHRQWTVNGWTARTSTSHMYDYGAVQLKTTPGNTVGYFGFRWQSSNTFSGTYTVRGYPGDKTSGTMWTMNGGVVGTSSSPRKLFYQIDTFGGQSGSPIYHYCAAPKCSKSGYYGVGIHAYGTGIAPYTGYNSGTRIIQAVFNNLLAWKNYAYP